LAGHFSPVQFVNFDQICVFRRILGVEDYEDMIDTMAEQLDPKFQEQFKKSRKEYEEKKVGTIEDSHKILRRKEKSVVYALSDCPSYNFS